MRLLCVHPTFPGQFKHLVPALLSRGDSVYVIRKPGGNAPASKYDRFQIYNYELKRPNTKNIHPLVLETESKVIRGEAVAKIASQLKANGFEPDLIIGHPGWGDLLFIGDIWPNVPQLHYLEFFHGVAGTDDDIRDRFTGDKTLFEMERVRMKNANLLLNLQQMKWGWTPTQFQKSVLPLWAQQKTTVIHDGIDTGWLKPDSNAEFRLPYGYKLRPGDPVVTFINRTFEPYRGIHIFLEALAKLQSTHSTVQVLMVGLDTANVSYGSCRNDGQGWLSALKNEMGNQLDWSRIHCLGVIPHSLLRSVYQVSAVHVYLTYPFVLSWSLVEAMSCGCLVVGSATAPVEELIQHNQNGILVPFQDPEALTSVLQNALIFPDKYKQLRANARKTAMSYDTKVCINKQIALIDYIVRCGLC